MTQKLTSSDHDRNVVGLKYVYPVISRRSGGLSIGLNFNSNNACNWRCMYCQVPDLTKGAAPELDFDVLEKELNYFFNEVLYGDFYARFNVPKAQRIIKDIALSGNGEPTSVKNFEKALQMIGRIATQAGIFPSAKFILITNGSFMHRADVKQGLRVLNHYNGQIWFKFDSATTHGLSHINNTALLPKTQQIQLKYASDLCQTTLHTCLVNYRQQGLLASEKNAYLKAVTLIKKQTNIQTITLYSLARPSLQAEAPDLEKMPFAIMQNFANDIRAIGFTVSVC
ncbi:MAG: radical SAM protein [Methylococcales bacterium]|nr:radical SAM protein [Methylococcales bacterium]